MVGAVVGVRSAGLGSLAVTWWSSPIDQAAVNQFPQLSPLMFDARGITPMGYAAFAFTLGGTVGMLIRRTLPAIAITLAIFAVVQIVMPLWARPHLIAPVQVNTAITATNLNGIKYGNGGMSPRAWLSFLDWQRKSASSGRFDRRATNMHRLTRRFGNEQRTQSGK